MPLYLLTVYAKGDQADLAPEDRRQLRSLVDLLRKVNGL